VSFVSGGALCGYAGMEEVKYILHPIYFLRLGLSWPFLHLGFGVYDFGIFLCAKGNKLQDLAIDIEGEVPDGAW
jgi:hypothetical protein